MLASARVTIQNAPLEQVPTGSRRLTTSSATSSCTTLRCTRSIFASLA